MLGSTTAVSFPLTVGRLRSACVVSVINLKYMWRRPYRAVNTLTVSVIKVNQLILYWEIIAVCSEIHTKRINTLCGQNVEFVDVKFGVTYTGVLISP